MLNRLVGEKDDYRDPESGSMRPKQWRWFHYAEIVAVAFVFISLFVLFGVVSNQKSTNNYYVRNSAPRCILTTLISLLLSFPRCTELVDDFVIFQLLQHHQRYFFW